jgi:hypothetical protein
MISQVVIPTESTFAISLPEDYIGKEIRITADIVFKEEVLIPKKKTLTFDEFAIDTTGFKFDREEANAR